jgi:trimeric autotransporter adhesin
MKKSSLLIIACAIFYFSKSFETFAQAPNSFNYQAVVRDASGNVLQNQNIALRIAILENGPTGNEIYAERHTKQTNNFGLVNLEIGTGSALTGVFASIPWGTITPWLKIGIDLAGGTSYIDFGTSKIQTVPYSVYASQLSYLQMDPVNQSVSLQAKPAAAAEDPIFEIKNKDGIVMFGVYNEGVRINVLEEELKGSKSGFAVGSFSRETKSDPTEIMRLTSDSVRFYIPDHPAGKSSKSGFAVGSFSRETKGAYFDLLDISPSQARVYIDPSIAKSSKGGFAVGSFSRETKADTVNFMNITPLNYFIGHSAGAANTTGAYNSFLGFEAGRNNTVGNHNIFLGYQSGFSNLNGEYNTAIGYQTGFSNLGPIEGQTGGGYGSFNSYLGYHAGYASEHGAHNTFIGYASGKNNQSDNNTFLGSLAGYSNISGLSNTFVGTEAGRFNTIGSGNACLGRWAGWNIENGHGNTLIGSYAGTDIRTGSGNVVIGSGAVSEQIYGSEGTASNNVVIGFEAGKKALYNNNNILIGYKAGYEELESDRLIIANSETATPLVYGLFTSNDFRINGNIQYTGVLTAISDERLKQNVLQLQGSLENLLKLRGISFDWNYEEKTNLLLMEGKQIGLIAQEVEVIYPELVRTNEQGYKMVDYAKLTPILLEAIREQQAEIDALKADLEWIKAMLQANQKE